MDNVWLRLIAALLLLLVCSTVWMAVHFRRFNRTVQEMQNTEFRHVVWQDTGKPVCKKPTYGPAHVMWERRTGPVCPACVPILMALTTMLKEDNER